jgi:phosphoribosylaminoimidazole (AIR) synthetase
MRARLDARLWTAPAIFNSLRQAGRVPTGDMLRTFNCGIGMIAVVGKDDAARVAKALLDAGENVREVGIIERAPTQEADCIIEHADSLWRN